MTAGPLFVVGCLLKEEANTQIQRIVAYAFYCVSYSLPLFLGVSLCYACFWRDVHTIYVLCATMLNSMWVVTIKELTRVDRPRPWCSSVAYLGHSMPSLHASIVVFLSTYYVYQFWMHARDVWTKNTLAARILALIIYASLVCYSRIHLVEARMEDVLVGSILGSSTTIAFLLVLRRHKYNHYKSSLKKD